MPRFRNRLELRILSTIFAATSLLWLFLAVAEEVIEGETRVIDTAMLLAFRSPDDVTRPLGPAWLQEFVRDISGLGSPGVLGLITLIVVVFLLLSRRLRTAIFVLATLMGGALISTLLKIGFDRPRPTLVPHGTVVYSASFPSSHAMISTIVYLTLGALIARLLTGESRLKYYVMAVSALFPVLIGVSRVYLGVHWPSDVLAGWAAGTAWVLGCWATEQIFNLNKKEK